MQSTRPTVRESSKWATACCRPCGSPPFSPASPRRRICTLLGLSGHIDAIYTLPAMTLQLLPAAKLPLARERTRRHGKGQVQGQGMGQGKGARGRVGKRGEVKAGAKARAGSKWHRRSAGHATTRRMRAQRLDSCPLTLPIPDKKGRREVGGYTCTCRGGYMCPGFAATYLSVRRSAIRYDAMVACRQPVKMAFVLSQTRSATCRSELARVDASTGSVPGRFTSSVAVRQSPITVIHPCVVAQTWPIMGRTSM